MPSPTINVVLSIANVPLENILPVLINLLYVGEGPGLKVMSNSFI